MHRSVFNEAVFWLRANLVGTLPVLPNTDSLLPQLGDINKPLHFQLIGNKNRLASA